MVKGISRQVILVHSPDPKLFEQAIFILKDEAVGKEGITDEILMQEAKRLIGRGGRERTGRIMRTGPIWALGGAVVMGLIWVLSTLI